MMTVDRREYFLPAVIAGLLLAAGCGGDSVGPGGAGEEPAAITGITPAVLRPGTDAEITGSGFSTLVSENLVRVDGVPVTVVSASGTTLQVRLPGRDKFQCGPEREVPISVEVSGAVGGTFHPLATARILQLAKGEESFISGSDLDCVELAEANGSYLLGIYNTNTSPTSMAAYRLQGWDAAATITMQPLPMMASEWSEANPVRADAPLAPGTLGLEEYAIRQEELRHYEHLERDLRLFDELGPWRGPAGRSTTSPTPVLAAPPPPTVGTVMPFRVPDPNSSNLCTIYHEIQARVVHVGPKAIVLEDMAAPLAGTMDSLYSLVAEEFERDMLPILEEYFGDPFAMVGPLGSDGRIRMVFSKLVNDAGFGGFVYHGDQRDRSQCASSSMAPTFYANVPTVAGSGYSSNTRDRWYRRIRSTVIHEVKHIVAHAAWLANDGVREVTWLEESTARLSQELWARKVYGYGQIQNADYNATLYCEEKGTTRAGCKEDTPRIMLGTFTGLWSYLSSMRTLSPLGRVRDGDNTFYNSGWSLVRWAIDHSSMTEQEFLRALTQERRLTGVANLEARAGRSIEEMLGYWALSPFLDDHPEITTRAEFTQPSWNIRDIYRGLNADLPTSIPRAAPVTPVDIGFGHFNSIVTELRGGSANLSLLSGSATGGQWLRLQGEDGGPRSATLRMVVVRVR